MSVGLSGEPISGVEWLRKNEGKRIVCPVCLEAGVVEKLKILCYGCPGQPTTTLTQRRNLEVEPHFQSSPCDAAGCGKVQATFYFPGCSHSVPVPIGHLPVAHTIVMLGLDNERANDRCQALCLAATALVKSGWTPASVQTAKAWRQARFTRHGVWTEPPFPLVFGEDNHKSGVDQKIAVLLAWPVDKVLGDAPPSPTGLWPSGDSAIPPPHRLLNANLVVIPVNVLDAFEKEARERMECAIEKLIGELKTPPPLPTQLPTLLVLGLEADDLIARLGTGTLSLDRLSAPEEEKPKDPPLAPDQVVRRYARVGLDLDALVAPLVKEGFFAAVDYWLVGRTPSDDALHRLRRRILGDQK